MSLTIPSSFLRTLDKIFIHLYSNILIFHIHLVSFSFCPKTYLSSSHPVSLSLASCCCCSTDYVDAKSGFLATQLPHWRFAQMASRFLSRCARLLVVCPQATSATSRLHILTAYPLAESPAWSQPLIQTYIRPLSLGAGPVHADEPNITFTRTELDIRVEKATTPREVLSLWAERGGSANQAGMCLIQLSRLALEKKDIDRLDILQDPHCVDLLETMNSQVIDGALQQQCEYVGWGDKEMKQNRTWSCYFVLLQFWPYSYNGQSL